MWVFPIIVGKPPKWMVKIRENPMKKWDDLGVPPLFFETPMSGSPTKNSASTNGPRKLPEPLLKTQVT